MPSVAVDLRIKKKVYDSSEELTLVHRAKGGDEDAFRALYDAHRHRVYVTINRMLANEDDTQVVANVAFLQVWRHLSSFKEQSRFSTWITRIAINEARMHLRSTKRRQHEVSLDVVLTEGIGSHQSTGTSRTNNSVSQARGWLAIRDLNLEGVIDRHLIERAIKKVPSQFQRLLRLRFWEGMTLSEIQAKLSTEETEPVSIPAIKSRMLRGKNLLKEQVEKFS